MARLERLTPEQEARFAEFRDRWIAIGLSTDPADRPRAEHAIRACYATANLPPPRRIVWCGSPLSQGLTRAIVLDQKVWDSVWASVGASVRDSVRDSVWDSVWASVGASVRDSVWASVGASVRASVGASVGASVRDSVRDSVWASVRASVRDSVWASVWASVGASVRDSVGASGYGQHDANWLAFYAYFREVCGLKDQTEPLQGLTDLSHAAGWWLPHQHLCWVSERHSLLARDERWRLHSMTGPAVRYPDGWAIYAVHGVRVPAQIIEDRASLTPAQITSEANTEVRRVMLSLYGEDRFIRDSGALPIHADDMGTLYRIELPDDEPLVMVRVLNSTPEPDQSHKPYYLRVPPDMQTARQAVAWTFNQDADAYRVVVET